MISGVFLHFMYLFSLFLNRSQLETFKCHVSVRSCDSDPKITTRVIGSQLSTVFQQSHLCSPKTVSTLRTADPRGGKKT